MAEAHYDDPAYVAQVVRSETNFATRYIEGPCLERMTPDLIGKRVLSLACGAGAECERFHQAGAEYVLGVDRVPGLVEEASRRFPHLDFRTMDMRALDLPPESFDFAYSSKAMHYVPDWRQVLVPLRRILTPGSDFLLSTHHPMTWASEVVRDGNRHGRILGYEYHIDDEDLTLHGNYLQGGSRQEQRSSMQIGYYHKPFNEIFAEIKDAGFRIEDLQEPVPVDAARVENERIHKIFTAFPLFMVMRLSRD